MTAETRTRIRTLIDLHRRAHLDAYRRARPLNYCKGCGGNLTDRTPGCGNCYDRQRRKQRAEYAKQRRNARPTICRCGRSFEDHTVVTKIDCVQCWDRQRYRRYKALRMAGD